MKYCGFLAPTEVSLNSHTRRLQCIHQGEEKEVHQGGGGEGLQGIAEVGGCDEDDSNAGVEVLQNCQDIFMSDEEDDEDEIYMIDNEDEEIEEKRILKMIQK